ncbi:hypothetical protein [Streptomyces sp. Inha503]|uniref:hypothetical protein n=1 Tax=Streptomyces sp. Inha503 TaxID=3383314 RepID=UPI0039A3B295
MAANAKVPGANVRILYVLPPAPGDADSGSAVADPDLWSAAPEAPVHTREAASPGYQQALAAHQASRPERVLDPRTAAAIEQQNVASSLREPEEAFGEGQAAVEELRAKAARAAAADSSRVIAAARTMDHRCDTRLACAELRGPAPTSPNRGFVTRDGWAGSSARVPGSSTKVNVAGPRTTMVSWAPDKREAHRTKRSQGARIRRQPATPKTR